MSDTNWNDEVNWHEELRKAKEMWAENSSKKCCSKYIDLAEQILKDSDCWRGFFAEEHMEVYAAKAALIECLRMAIYQDANKKTHLLIKTEGGEEEPAMLIPQEEVESVLARYGGKDKDENL